MRNSSEFASGIQHDLTKGEFREALLIDVLTKVLPFKYSITYGCIICVDGDDTQSMQQDIIIYDRLNCPRITLDMEGGVSFVPIESVFCIIEVMYNNRFSNGVNVYVDKESKYNAYTLITNLGISVCPYCDEEYLDISIRR